MNFQFDLLQYQLLATQLRFVARLLIVLGAFIALLTAAYSIATLIIGVGIIVPGALLHFEMHRLPICTQNRLKISEDQLLLSNSITDYDVKIRLNRVKNVKMTVLLGLALVYVDLDENERLTLIAYENSKDLFAELSLAIHRRA
ncbi:hypothetical protein M0C34_08850 [Agarivorans sp. TSD2052]|uniref:hypothetical protein n=1 Tax=Agarivorans sp. TSD2052 TaxID=2937286 RepID=UPI0020104AE1|nr:hypothetical protein [Agarivorans sp. TSD2052]UPW20352.1 hypothetical protein M0C34_08850 [Agarivorans sp. TSD2052]